MGKFRDLMVYQKGFALLMEIFETTKSFPSEETYSLISQIRRSSRSVCSNIGEGYKKRQYPKYFLSKLSDAAMENTETQVWLDVALGCKYISQDKFLTLDNQCEEVNKLLNYMINNPSKFS